MDGKLGISYVLIPSIIVYGIEFLIALKKKNDKGISIEKDFDNYTSYFLSHLMASPPNDLETIERQYLTSGPIFKYLEMIREIVFEKIRSNYYSHLPSRQKGIWLTDLEHLSAWKDIFPKDDGTNIVFKVRCNGIIHKADESWMKLDSIKLSDYIEKAKKYWAGDIDKNNSNTVLEYLLEGEIELLEIIE